MVDGCDLQCQACVLIRVNEKGCKCVKVLEG